MGLSSYAFVAPDHASLSSLGMASWLFACRALDVYEMGGVSIEIMTVLSLLGNSFGRVIVNNKTFIQPEEANVKSANAVASKETLILGLEKVIHRTTAMGKT